MSRGRPARVGAPASLAFERQLVRELRPMIRQVRASLAQVESVSDLRALQAAIKREWSEARIRATVERIARKAEAAGSRPWRPLVRKAAAKGDAARADARKPPAFDGDKLIAEWSRDAVKRITSVRDDLVEGMRGDLVDALLQGRSPKELTAKWVKQGIPVSFGTLEGRMKVIAQNQLGILHAKVQSERARSLGVEEFVWRTQRDSRVRDAHRALEGTKHRYDKPPSEGLPGTPINCRCWAESVIGDDLLEELGVRPGRLFGSAQPSP